MQSKHGSQSAKGKRVEPAGPTKSKQGAEKPKAALGQQGQSKTGDWNCLQTDLSQYKLSEAELVELA